MANVLVYVELDLGGRPTWASRFALAEARRVSNALGATVYAWVTAAAFDGGALEALGRALGTAGADRVMACAAAPLGGPLAYTPHGEVLEGIVRKLRPRLLLFPAGTAAAVLAPMLAARSRAAFAPRVAIEAEPATPGDATGGVLELHRLDPDEGRGAILDVLQTDRPVVCSLMVGAQVRETGGAEAECELLAAPELSSAPFELLARAAREVDTVSQCHTLMIGDAPAEPIAGAAVVSAAQALQQSGLLCPARLVWLGEPHAGSGFASMAAGWVAVCDEAKGGKALPPGTVAVWRTKPDVARAALLETHALRATSAKPS